MRKKILVVVLITLTAALIAGAFVWTVAAPGSQDDPFITLNYLTEVFKPQILQEINNAGANVSRQIDAKIAELEASLGNDQGSGTPEQGNADSFAVVTLSRGQTLTCSVGAEIMLRIGTAVGVGSQPALVNYTTGEALSDGTSLTVNNMYLVTIEGNGVRATTDAVKVLVRGMYTIS